MTDDPLLTLQDVSVHFTKKRLLGLAGSETVRAVDGVSLDVYENDVVALVGESGCGKTTLGKTAIGVQRPTDGEVLYRGQDLWATKDGGPQGDGYSYEEMRRLLQMIYQDPGSSLSPNYTVESTLADPLKRWEPEMSAIDRRARIHGLLEYVGMTPAADYAERYPHQLSGGEKQRVALVRALLMNPDVILADEAVSALDVSLRVDMMNLMLELQDQFDTSYVFISHNLTNAAYLTRKTGGRIGIMYLGELVEIGPPNRILHDPQHPYTKVLLWATADMRDTEGEIEDPPVRSLDVPDPADPPSGCRFHTRCPEARVACTREAPELTDHDGDGRRTACFRQVEGHPYWESDELDSRDTATAEADGTGVVSD